MDRTQRAIQYAKDRVIDQTDGLFADKDYRIKWWGRAGMIERSILLQTLEAYMMEDLSRIEWLKVIE